MFELATVTPILLFSPFHRQSCLASLFDRGRRQLVAIFVLAVAFVNSRILSEEGYVYSADRARLMSTSDDSHSANVTKEQAHT